MCLWWSCSRWHGAMHTRASSCHVHVAQRRPGAAGGSCHAEASPLPSRLPTILRLTLSLLFLLFLLLLLLPFSPPSPPPLPPCLPSLPFPSLTTRCRPQGARAGIPLFLPVVPLLLLPAAAAATAAADTATVASRPRYKNLSDHLDDDTAPSSFSSTISTTINNSDDDNDDDDDDDDEDNNNDNDGDDDDDDDDKNDDDNNNNNNKSWSNSTRPAAPAAGRGHRPYATATSPRSSLQRGWAHVPQKSVLLPHATTRSQLHVIDCDMSVVEQA